MMQSKDEMVEMDETGLKEQRFVNMGICLVYWEKRRRFNSGFCEANGYAWVKMILFYLVLFYN